MISVLKKIDWEEQIEEQGIPHAKKVFRIMSNTGLFWEKWRRKAMEKL